MKRTKNNERNLPDECGVGCHFEFSLFAIIYFVCFTLAGTEKK